MNSFRLPVVIADLVFYLFGEGRHGIYVVLELADHLDFQRLREAMRQSFRLHPILTSRFVEAKWLPSWRLNDPDSFPSDAYCRLDEIDSEADVLQLATQIEVAASDPPLCKVRVFRTPVNDVLCLKYSHIVGDGSSCLAYARLLSELYAAEPSAAASTPSPLTYPRGMSVLASQWSAWQRWRTFLDLARKQRSRKRGQEAQSKGPIWSFPSPADPPVDPPRVFFEVPLSPETTRSLDQSAKRRAATLNDLLLAALYQAAGKTVGVKSAGPWTMRSTVNLRRKPADARTSPLCNLSAGVPLELSVSPESEFSEILPAVVKATRGMKRQFVRCSYSLSPFAVLEATPFLSLLRYVLPFALVKRKMRQNMAERRAAAACKCIVLSNIGDYTFPDNEFGGHRISKHLVNADSMLEHGFGVGLWNGQLIITGVNDSRELSRSAARALLQNFVDCLEEVKHG